MTCPEFQIRRADVTYCLMHEMDKRICGFALEMLKIKQGHF